VNSDTQMKQHLGSLRHKNTIAGVPVPPRPDKIEPVKPRSNHQYKCELCHVTLNSEVQLLQHLRSQRHKATLEGKPPKPRWVPYERFREQQRIQAKIVSEVVQVTVLTNLLRNYNPRTLQRISRSWSRTSRTWRRWGSSGTRSRKWEQCKMSKTYRE
jgi:hypothetical protein